jgi:sugar phosphate isomerase/epimerase
MDKSRISAITDEIGLSTEESIAFAHHFGLQNVEIRNPAGSKKEYFALTEPEIKVDADWFAREGLKVSFVNTSLLKFAWPGSEPPRRTPEQPAAREKRLATETARWDRRMDDFPKAIRCAQIMGCDKVRVFTGARVAIPRPCTNRSPIRWERCPRPPNARRSTC